MAAPADSLAGGKHLTVRYFSPEAEVSFCGHATIATGVALGVLAGDGEYVLETAVGQVPVAVASDAGAWHLVLAVTSLDRLNRLDYDFDRLKQIMQDDGLTTVQLVWRESDAVFHARNPFPVGGVVEDSATGAAAAALGGYLRDAGLITAPAQLTIRRGEAMGSPSRLTVVLWWRSSWPIWQRERSLPA